MKVKFSTAHQSLSIDKLSQIKIISFDDYGKDYQSNINFPPGAHEIKVILGRSDTFSSIIDFFIHVSSIPYARFTSYELPSVFYDKQFIFDALNKDEINKYISAYFDGFFEGLYPISSTLNLWNVSLSVEQFKEGYKVQAQGSEQILIIRTEEYFLYFVSEAIN